MSKLFDRVKETSTTIGTGAITLGGAVSAYQAFSAVYADGDTMPYVIQDQSSTNWECGLGTYNSGANTLSRTKITASSNSGSAVNFTSASLFVFPSVTAYGINTLPNPAQVALSGGF